MTDCPCGSGSSLSTCCQPIINGDVKAERAEALIRARYTAHTIGAIDFIMTTHHPSTRTDIDETATARWAKESQWLGLEILNVDGGEPDDTSARIEFMARYRDGARRRHTHHERGVFEKYHGHQSKVGMSRVLAEAAKNTRNAAQRHNTTLLEEFAWTNPG